jgi:hypothetical protein
VAGASLYITPKPIQIVTRNSASVNNNSNGEQEKFLRVSSLFDTFSIKASYSEGYTRDLNGLV